MSRSSSEALMTEVGVPEIAELALASSLLVARWLRRFYDVAERKEWDERIEH